MYKNSTKRKTIQIGLFNVISGVSDTCRKVLRKIAANVYEISI